MNLKPQDVVVALKLFSYPQQRPPFSVIAVDLGLSPSEVHGAMRRLQSARLIHGPEMQDKPNVSALEEFLIHGLKYAFPGQRGSVTRGIPTSYAASPLKTEIAPGDELPPVWPWHEGDTRGIALEPLYKSVPSAALRDPALYEFLAIVDAIRDGRARERKIAERELIKRIRSKNAKS
jgi:DNA-binding Lrp family transcriptional regulator